MTESYRVESLDKSHDRAAFSCGNGELDRYLREQAMQDQRRSVSSVYVMIEVETGTIAGYYTLSAAAIEPQGLPPETFKRLPRYPTVPATLLGRLARDLRYHGGGIGQRLLADALLRSLRVSREVASVGVVDAIDDAAQEFYERHGFIRLLDTSRRLILPMETIKKLVDAT